MYFDLLSRRWLFKPDGAPSGGADAPIGTNVPQPDAQSSAAPQEQQTFTLDYVKALREEAKASRLQVKAVSGELEALKAAAGNNQELASKLNKVSADLAQAQAEAAKATQRADLVRLAAKAGAPIDLVEMLDVSKLDLKDEEKVIEMLGKYAPKQVPAAQAKPGTFLNTGLTDEELRAEIFGGKKFRFFGG